MRHFREKVFQIKNTDYQVTGVFMHCFTILGVQDMAGCIIESMNFLGEAAWVGEVEPSIQCSQRV